MILCECGEIIDGGTFKDFIKTSSNPSTPTIGHDKCGYIFNFIDNKMYRKYSSRKELKTIAIRYAEKKKIGENDIERYLMEVDRMKSNGNSSDCEILINAYMRLQSSNGVK
ncbi:MAG: hypothetical protein C3F06_11855 [Candidatus Methanoperedenaceae archaeon]|nr:MAG: hypothetical protein C3F06_11855 [Candidatus Methanoperedenaceae archaeon]